MAPIDPKGGKKGAPAPAKPKEQPKPKDNKKGGTIGTVVITTTPATVPTIEYEPGKTPIVASYKTPMTKSSNSLLHTMIERMVSQFSHTVSKLRNERNEIKDKEYKYKFYWDKTNLELYGDE